MKGYILVSIMIGSWAKPILDGPVQLQMTYILVSRDRKSGQAHLKMGQPNFK